MCCSKIDIEHSDELLRPMDNFLLNESLWNDKCDYIHPDSYVNLNPDNYKLIILQLNIRGLVSHQTELKWILHYLNNKNSSVDVILLCKTFLSKKIENLVQIPGYTLIANHCKQSKGGGTVILIKEGLTFNRHRDLDVFIEKQAESVFIKFLTKNNKYIVIKSMY